MTTRTGTAFAESVWRVREGREPDFLARWNELADAAAASGAATRLVLLRDRTDPRRFVSFGEWVDGPTMTAYRGRSDFRRLFLACREVCESFEGRDYDPVDRAPGAQPSTGSD